MFRIKDNVDNWMEGLNEVLNGIWDFYSDLYSAEPISNTVECIRVIPNCVSSSMNDTLCSPVSFKEVEIDVLDLGACKAPGPDSLNQCYKTRLGPAGVTGPTGNRVYGRAGPLLYKHQE